jgi:hypothetical protein
MRRSVVAAAVAAAVAGGLAAPASAVTLGSTAIPAGATGGSCGPGAFFAQAASDPGTSYTVPAGGGELTAWSVSTAAGSGGSPITLLVLRLTPTGTYTVVGSDTRGLPAPLPGGGVASFPLATPITVSGGEVLGLYAGASLQCYSIGGATPAAAVLAAGSTTVTTPGTSLTPTATPAGYQLRVAAELSRVQDPAVTAATTPGTIAAGGSAAYTFTVTNHGPASGAITFAGDVPDGLTPLLAVAGAGRCATAGQHVSCTLALPVGESAPVAMVVRAPSAGTYAATGAVSAETSDPNPADNAASATLTVDAPVVPPPATVTTTVTTTVPTPTPPVCRTIALKGAKVALAKKAIVALNCRVGKVTRARSKSVKKGLVISTNPGGSRTWAYGTVVTIVESSGPPPRKKRAR